MKLATLRDGSRDGQLVVVSRDLSLAHYATGIATRLQQVLDDWNFLSPQLNDLYVTLNHGKARHAFAFEPRQCMAPLPRTSAWLVTGSGAEPAPALQPALGDALLGPCDDPWPAAAPDAPAAADAATAGVAAAQAPGLDGAAVLAVITGDIAAGSTGARALEGVRLLLLMAQWHWHDPGAAGAVPALGASCAPVAVTPDELGEAWARGRVALPLALGCSGRRIGLCDGASDQAQGFGTLLAQAVAWRALRPGSVLAGAVLQCADGTRGHASLAQRRAHEAAELGSARSPYLRPGDTLQLEARARDGSSVFGAIVARLGPAPEDAAAAADGAPEPSQRDATAPEATA